MPNIQHMNVLCQQCCNDYILKTVHPLECIVINVLKHTFSFFLIFIVIQLQLYAFSPYASTPPQLNPPPSPTSTISPNFVHVSFIIVPAIPSSHCPHPTPPWPLLDCSQPQCLWLYFKTYIFKQKSYASDLPTLYMMRAKTIQALTSKFDLLISKCLLYLLYILNYIFC